MAQPIAKKGHAASHLFRWALVAAALSLGFARSARAQEPVDGDDVLWAGDDAWSVPATQQPDQQAPPPADSDDQWAGDQAPPPADTTTVDSNTNYSGGGDSAQIEYSAPRYSDFREGLSPYGEWIDTPEYGRVWRPTHVSSSWRPYLDGRWVYTHYGWTWVAEEPFGWATYHYGRWWYSPIWGWSWLPGRVWAPAWVSWRYGGGNCGWAPLGPRGVVYYEPTRWVFVNSVHFVQPIRRWALPAHRTYAVFNQVTPIPMVRPGLRAGPPAAVISRSVGYSIRPVPLRIAGSHAAATRPSQLDAGAVHVYRPRGVPFRPQAAAVRSGIPVAAPHHQNAPRGNAEPRPAPVQRPPARPQPRGDAYRPAPQVPRYQDPPPRPRPMVERRPAQAQREQPRVKHEQPRQPIYFGGVASRGMVERQRVQAQAEPPRERWAPQQHEARPEAQHQQSQPKARPVEAKAGGNKRDRK